MEWLQSPSKAPLQGFGTGQPVEALHLERLISPRAKTLPGPCAPTAAEMRLRSRVALVTGPARSIGEAIAAAFARPDRAAIASAAECDRGGEDQRNEERQPGGDHVLLAHASPCAGARRALNSGSAFKRAIIDQSCAAAARYRKRGPALVRRAPPPSRIARQRAAASWNFLS
jgi:hypothetical protein